MERGRRGGRPGYGIRREGQEGNTVWATVTEWDAEGVGVGKVGITEPGGEGIMFL